MGLFDFARVDPRGYGLVQWTPASKLTDWAYQNRLNPAEIYTQLKRLNFEVANCHVHSINPFWDRLDRGMTFKDFIKLRETPEEMARIFVINYERPSQAGMKLVQRQSAARRWYNKFNGVSGVTPAPSPNPPSNNGDQYYIVQAGDSFWSISRKFGLTVEELLSLNNLSSSHIIHPGDRLIVKKGISTPPKDSSSHYYTVQAGDSFWSISRKFGLTVEELLRLNNLTRDYVIHPGDRLLVKAGASASQPQPQPQPEPRPISPESERLITSYAESGCFTANQALGIHNQHQKNSAVVTTLYAGESVHYDSVYITNLHVWISYIS